jgi:Ricin-type beta-trefoil lectin domain-like
MRRRFFTLITTGIAAMALAIGIMSAAAHASAGGAARPVRPGSAEVGGLVITGSSSAGFRIHNSNARGKCIGIPPSTWAGDYYCTTNPDQTWHWGAANSAGFRQLINGQGKCLGVNGGSTVEGALLRAWRCNGHADQFWSTETVPNHHVDWILNYQSSYVNPDIFVIAVLNGSTANGAAVIQWPANEHADQMWSF